MFLSLLAESYNKAYPRIFRTRRPLFAVSKCFGYRPHFDE